MFIIVGVTAPVAAMPINPRFALTSVQGTQWIHLINTDLTDWGDTGTVVNITFHVKPTAPTGISSVNLSFTAMPDGAPGNAVGNILSGARTISGSVDVVAVTIDTSGTEGIIGTEGTNNNTDDGSDGNTSERQPLSVIDAGEIVGEFIGAPYTPELDDVGAGTVHGPDRNQGFGRVPQTGF
jgi:hypothetical protein